MISTATISRVAARLGYWSAILTAVFCALFTVAAVLTEARLLSAPWHVILPIVPSLLLAPSFLVMLACVNAVVSSERQIWSQLGVAFGCVYVPLCVAAYVVELFVVQPRVLRGATGEMALLTLVRSDSVFNAIDGVYSTGLRKESARTLGSLAFSGERCSRRADLPHVLRRSCIHVGCRALVGDDHGVGGTARIRL